MAVTSTLHHPLRVFSLVGLHLLLDQLHLLRVRLLVLLNRTSRSNTAQLLPIVCHLLLWILVEDLVHKLSVVLLGCTHLLLDCRLRFIKFKILSRLEGEASVLEDLVLPDIHSVHINARPARFLRLLLLLLLFFRIQVDFARLDRSNQLVGASVLMLHVKPAGAVSLRDGPIHLFLILLFVLIGLALAPCSG